VILCVKGLDKEMPKTKKREYKRSPWSGKAYEQPPTADELTAESKAVLQRNPAIAKAMSLESMDKFIEAYKTQNERLTR
jgi:hypothetical protein